MNGLEVAKHLGVEQPKAKILVMRQQDSIQLLEAGGEILARTKAVSPVTRWRQRLT
jgi:hypothetical protein